MNLGALNQPRQLLPLLLMLLLLILASAVRFHRLGEQSLWYDEGVAYNHALRTLPELIPLLQRNVHVPAYFTLLGLWEDVAGASEFALRSLSVFFSLISVALAYALGSRLFHPLAGLSAAAFVAMNSFSIYYAAEARMYAMLTAIAAGSMLLFVILLRQYSRAAPGHSRRRGIIALALMNALGLYTHVVFALILLTQFVLALLWLAVVKKRERQAPAAAAVAAKTLLAYLFANALSLLLFSPWIPTALSQVFAQPNIAAPIALDNLLREIGGIFAFGLTYELGLGNMIYVVLFLLALGLLPSAGLLPPDRRGRAVWNMLLPVAWLVVSVGIYLAMDLGMRYLRFLLPAQLACALWMGRGLWVLWSLPISARLSAGLSPHLSALRLMPKLAAALAAGGLLLVQFNALPILYQHADFQRDDLRGLVRQIEADLHADDALIVSAAGLAEVLGYYYRAAAPVYGLPLSADADRTQAQVKEIIAAHERLHVIFYGAAEQDPEGLVEATLNQNAFEISDVWVGDLRYAQYASPGDFSDAQPLNARFGQHITLASVVLGTLGAQAALPGDVLQVQFTWVAAAALEKRYKVFLQLLNADGALVAQRDSEPVAGLAKTVDWQPGAPVIDNHALLLPIELPPGDYQLIAGLYDIDDAAARLSVGIGLDDVNGMNDGNDGNDGDNKDGADSDYLELARIRVG